MGTFNQALVITVVGMGLTFAAIGLVVVAMYALTYLTRDREGAVMEKAPLRESRAGSIPDAAMAELEQAAAVAVAVALAEAARSVEPTHAWHSARPGEEPSAWQSYSRGQQLEQRKTHQSLRW